MFVLEKGRFKRIVLPGDPIGDDIIRINNRGQIAGTYCDTGPCTAGFHGFLRDERGRFTRIDVPGAAGTSPFDLDDRGQIVGIYSHPDSNTGRAADKRGFLRDERGRFNTIHVPGSVQTQAFGINNRGQVVGEYLDAGGRYHGFRWDEGRFTTIDVPGSAGTSALDINDRGQIIGVHGENAGTPPVHGFLC